MPSKGIFYGVAIVLVSLLMISSSVALYYYGQDQVSSSQNAKYVGELNTALTSYRLLSSSFNSSLKDYNTTLSLLATAVANLNTSTPAYGDASVALPALWEDYQRLSSASGRDALVYAVHMLVDFGNGTREWYNSTSVQPGWNGYVASLVLLHGRIQGAWYPQYGEHFVTAVDGVSQSSSTSWFVWEFSGGEWSASTSGADQVPIDNGTTIAWTLCGFDANYNPACSP